MSSSKISSELKQIAVGCKTVDSSAQQTLSWMQSTPTEKVINVLVKFIPLKLKMAPEASAALLLI